MWIAEEVVKMNFLRKIYNLDYLKMKAWIGQHVHYLKLMNEETPDESDVLITIYWKKTRYGNFFPVIPNPLNKESVQGTEFDLFKGFVVRKDEIYIKKEYFEDDYLMEFHD